MITGIEFTVQDVVLPLTDPDAHSLWLERLIHAHNKFPEAICVIFCSDEYLLELNRQYLDHDTLTDVITFDYCQDNKVSGDVFISVDRVTENASTYGKPMIEELRLVIAHGVLHLIGFKDKTPEEASAMRKEEERALALLQTIAP